MDLKIYTKYVTLTFKDHNEIVKDLTIKEADETIHTKVVKLIGTECMDIIADIEFEDGTKISEEMRICPTDVLVDNIVRYYVVGNIRWKAGLMAYAYENPDKYYEELKKYDTLFYRKLYEHYSLYYSDRKISNKRYSNTGINKIIVKLQKQRSKEMKQIDAHKLNIAFIDGTIKGLNSFITNDVDQDKITSELQTLNESAERYQYLKGVLNGLQTYSKLSTAE